MIPTTITPGVSHHTRAFARRQLRRFGLRRFRGLQLDIISCVLVGRHVLVTLATGRGKSLCFQMPALIFTGLTVIVSPTISLMVDQVTRFNRAIPGDLAAYINGTLTPTEINSVLRRVGSGSIKLLYLAPERLTSVPFLRTLDSTPISLLVIDEAHCVYQDGIYREQYLLIGEFARRHYIPRIAAFTATAPRGPKTDSIVGLLGLRDPLTFRGPLNRPNLFYSVTDCSNNGDRNAELVRQLHALHDIKYFRGVIYCARRKDIPDVLQFVRSVGYSATSYHGGPKTAGNRARLQRNLRRFLDGNRQVLVTTKAFETGVDVSDIRFVIVFNAPPSLEALLQMWGRAGRDGLLAYCSLLTALQDAKIHGSLMDDSLSEFSVIHGRLPRAVRRLIPLEEYREQQLQDFQRVILFIQNTLQCRRRALLVSQNRVLRTPPALCCDVCNPASGFK